MSWILYIMAGGLGITAKLFVQTLIVATYTISVCEKTVWCAVHKPSCSQYAKIGKTGHELTWSMVLGTNRCLVYVNPMINEC